VAPFGALEQCADVLVVVSTMVSMIIMIMLSTQPLPARGADDHHRRSSLAGGGEVTARSRSASPGVLGCAANATTSDAAIPQVRRLFSWLARAIWLTCDC
jgi:hypothetical protein